MERRCNSCKKTFPLDTNCFFRAKTRPGGFGYACKPCASRRGLDWRKRNPEKHAKYQRAFEHKWRSENRRKALLIIGNGILSCVRCGESRFELLEMNHKYGGGNQERKRMSSSNICREIITGKRAVDDLELLCRPCNLVHAAELISGKHYEEVSRPQ